MLAVTVAFGLAAIAAAVCARRARRAAAADLRGELVRQAEVTEDLGDRKGRDVLDAGAL
jgi:hypothetical protein